MQRRTAILASLAAMLPVAARAHHGWGSYQPDKPLTLTGIVKTSAFENPHGILGLQTPDKLWEVVLSPPSRMISRGLQPEMIKVGEEVQVMGYPHRSREIELRAEWIKVKETTTQLR